jgi:hypothetical protein
MAGPPSRADPRPALLGRRTGSENRGIDRAAVTGADAGRPVAVTRDTTMPINRIIPRSALKTPGERKYHVNTARGRSSNSSELAGRLSILVAASGDGPRAEILNASHGGSRSRVLPGGGAMLTLLCLPP